MRSMTCTYCLLTMRLRPNSDEHVGTFQQLEVVLKVMQLEGHLTASPVYQNEVAVVPVSLHIDNLIDSYAYQQA